MSDVTDPLHVERGERARVVRVPECLDDRDAVELSAVIAEDRDEVLEHGCSLVDAGHDVSLACEDEDATVVGNLEIVVGAVVERPDDVRILAEPDDPGALEDGEDVAIRVEVGAAPVMRPLLGDQVLPVREGVKELAPPLVEHDPVHVHEDRAGEVTGRVEVVSAARSCAIVDGDAADPASCLRTAQVADGLETLDLFALFGGRPAGRGRGRAPASGPVGAVLAALEGRAAPGRLLEPVLVRHRGTFAVLHSRGPGLFRALGRSAAVLRGAPDHHDESCHGQNGGRARDGGQSATHSRRCRCASQISEHGSSCESG